VCASVQACAYLNNRRACGEDFRASAPPTHPPIHALITPTRSPVVIVPPEELVCGLPPAVDGVGRVNAGAAAAALKFPCIAAVQEEGGCTALRGATCAGVVEGDIGLECMHVSMYQCASTGLRGGESI
jgi:hypothetical protein